MPISSDVNCLRVPIGHLLGESCPRSKVSVNPGHLRATSSTVEQIARRHGVDLNSVIFSRLAGDMETSQFANATWVSAHQ